MSTTFKLKRKLYSGEDEKKGMGLGTKLAIGTAAIGGAFLGAKKGMFGNVGRMAAGRVQMGAGKMLNSKSMFKGGATSYSKGYMGEVNKLNGGTLSKMQQGRGAVTVRNNLMNNFNTPKPGNTTLPAVVK